MVAIAEAFAEYARPLLEQTDGSQEQIEKAFAMSQICFNLALLPETDREESLLEAQHDLAMNDVEFRAFRRDVVDPMIQRHERMFPFMHARASMNGRSGSPATPAKTPAPADRYAPCPCNSGKKYKFCCGKKGL